MRKLLLIFFFLILALAFAAALVWVNRTNLAAHFLSRHLNNVPVTINALDFYQNGASIDHLWTGNPPHSKTNTSFSSKTIDIQATPSEIFGSPLIIEEIHFQDILFGLEFYNAAGTKSNWSYILKSHAPKKKPKRDYLIRTLVLKNLTVEVTQANGKTTRYPTIARMEFHNINSETGFPVEEIEKAIFHLVMQDIFQRLNLKGLFENLQNIPGSPLKYFPNPFN